MKLVGWPTLTVVGGVPCLNETMQRARKVRFWSKKEKQVRLSS